MHKKDVYLKRYKILQVGFPRFFFVLSKNNNYS